MLFYTEFCTIFRSRASSKSAVTGKISRDGGEGGISRVAYYDGVTLALSTASDRLAAQAVIGRGPANRRYQPPSPEVINLPVEPAAAYDPFSQLLRQHIIRYASLQLQIQLYLTMSDKNDSSLSKGKAKEKKKSPAAKEKIILPPSSAKAESHSSLAGATSGRGPARDMSLPVSIPISVDTGGAITILDDPRWRESVSLTRVDTLTEPVEWETKIAKMVETALPAALGAPARLPESPLSAPTLQSGQQLTPTGSSAGAGPFSYS